MSREKLTVAQQRQIAREYVAGATLDELSIEYGVDPGTVRRAVGCGGGTLRPGGRPSGWNEHIHRQAVAMYESGTPMREIARHFRVADKTVSDNFKASGVAFRRAAAVPRPTGQGTPGPPSRWTPQLEAELVAAFNAGESQASIARRFGFGDSTVSKKLYDLGVAVRGRVARRKGGRSSNAAGYVYVLPTPEDLQFCRPNSTGYVFEHRLVMGRALGRPLARHETVHHINGDRADNRLENLQLRVGNHGQGVALRCINCGSHNVESVRLAAS